MTANEPSSFTLYLQGGLGNQLFQACIYEYLRDKNWVRCVVDPSLLPGFTGAVTPRNLESAFLFDRADLLPAKSPVLTGVALRFQRLLGRLYVERSDDVGSWQNLLHSRYRHLLGYFQDWRLVELAWPSLGTRIAQDDGWSAILSGPLQRRLAVHYRLGDYVTNPAARRHHGVTHPSFFSSLADQIRREDTDLEVVVVSDDPDLAQALFRTNAGGIDATFSALSGPLEDLAVIASSSHVIMSNSSFSWWGAWISSRKGGSVFAPHPWFAQEDAHEGLLPADWRLEPRTVMSDGLLSETLMAIGRQPLNR